MSEVRIATDVTITLSKDEALSVCYVLGSDYYNKMCAWVEEDFGLEAGERFKTHSTSDMFEKLMDGLGLE